MNDSLELDVRPVDGLLADSDNTAAETQLDAPAVAEVQAAPARPEGFIRLGLADELVAAVADLGYTEPTAVQERTIPLAMQPEDGKGHAFNDLMVSSQTGSGKTAAFLLPVLHTLIRQQQEQAEAEAQEWAQQVADAAARGEPAPKRARRKDPTNPRNFKPAAPGALVLCPTRELAQQVAHDAIGLVQHCRGLRIASIVGGVPYQVQIARLQNANLIVATPGRLLDLQRSGQLRLDQVQFLVVDEADRMLDLGFSDDLAEVNNLTAQRRQTMMFSATFAPRIQQLAMRVMHDGGAAVQRVQIDTPHEKHANIRQVMFWADNPKHKRALLDHWLRDTQIDQAIVFASTQIECDNLANDLQQDGFSAVALHGALSQGLRNRRLMALRNGQVQILVATDVAARGIDVPTITHVFNFGLPMKAEDYTHRIGRTGRAGRDGIAVTFGEFRDRRRLMDIEAYTRQAFQAEVIPGLEPTQRFPSLRPEPGRGGPRKGGGFGAGGRGQGGGGFGGPRNRDDGYGRKPGFGDRAPDARFADRAPDARFAPRDDRFAPRDDRGPRPARADGYRQDGFRQEGFRHDGPRQAPRGEFNDRGHAAGDRPQWNNKPAGNGGKVFVPRDAQRKAGAPRPYVKAGGAPRKGQ